MSAESGDAMHSKPVHAIFNGRRLSGLLSGEGQVTVVLEAGLGGTIEDWARVQPEVAKFARVFSYDRAGLGQSEKAPTPRTCEDFGRPARSAPGCRAQAAVYTGGAFMERTQRTLACQPLSARDRRHDPGRRRP